MAGFSWAITQWAPFALVGPFYPSLPCVLGANAAIPYQLAEAILEDDTEIEDANSIVLDDARARRLSGHGDGEDHERQFLVGNDEEEEHEELEDEVQSFRSSMSMDTEQERAKAELFMNNASARRSHLDVHVASSSRLSLHLDGEGEVAKEKKGGGLAAKAGIILVRQRHVWSSSPQS